MIGAAFRMLGGAAVDLAVKKAGQWAFGAEKAAVAPRVANGPGGWPQAMQSKPAASPAGPSRFDRVTHELTSGRLVNGLYAVDASMRMVDRALAYVKPHFYHTVVVAVKGGPTATMTRTWQLACSLAFGQMRNSVGVITDHAVDATWDISKKAVQITVSYSLGYQSWLGAREFIRRGPISSTVGAGWIEFLAPPAARQGLAQQALGGVQGAVIDIFDPLGLGLLDGINPQGIVNVRVIGGRPANPIEAGQIAQMVDERRKALLLAGLNGQFDVLPDDGRLILTELKQHNDVQPYRPVDYGDLLSLVSNALTDPGFLPSEPPPGPKVGNPNGVYFYNPGEIVKESVLAGRLVEFFTRPAAAIGGAIANLVAGVVGALGGFGLDGYVRRGRGETPPAIDGPTHPERKL